MTKDSTTVAVLGTGIMGAAMARRLIGGGLAVRVWNRTRERAEPLGESGAVVADTPADAARDMDVVVTMLSDGAAVESAMLGERGALAAMHRGAIWLQMSTVGIDAAERFARAAEEAGVVYVDAPVLGTKAPAERGELLVLASGPEEARERLEPVLAPLAKRTMWVGEAGQGNRLKLVINAWLLGMLGALAESIALAEKVGVDPKTFLAAIDGGPIFAPYAKLKGTMMIDRQFPASFPLRLAAKDARLVQQAARAAGIQARVAATVEALFEDAATKGHAEEDMAAVLLAYLD